MFSDEPDLMRELDAADDIVMGREPEWRSRAEAAEAKLAAITEACRATRCSPGCVGHSMDAARILAIIGSEERPANGC